MGLVFKFKKRPLPKQKKKKERDPFQKAEMSLLDLPVKRSDWGLGVERIYKGHTFQVPSPTSQLG